MPSICDVLVVDIVRTAKHAPAADGEVYALCGAQGGGALAALGLFAEQLRRRLDYVTNGIRNLVQNLEVVVDDMHAVERDVRSNMNLANDFSLGLSLIGLGLTFSILALAFRALRIASEITVSWLAGMLLLLRQ